LKIGWTVAETVWYVKPSATPPVLEQCAARLLVVLGINISLITPKKNEKENKT
jgi:hypothetical protein